MLKKIVLVLLLGIAIFAAVAAMQPDDFRVSRSIEIKAPVSTVFNQVSNLRSWEAWSPWLKRDPNMKLSYSGPEFGVGAISAWEGNSEVGSGRMTTVAEEPDVSIKFNLEFYKPFEGSSTADFTFTPVGENVKVVWTMNGKSHFFCKAMGLIFNVDKMIGDDFEAGLSGIKVLAEQAAVPGESVS